MTFGTKLSAIRFAPNPNRDPMQAPEVARVCQRERDVLFVLLAFPARIRSAAKMATPIGALTVHDNGGTVQANSSPEPNASPRRASGWCDHFGVGTLGGGAADIR